MLCFLVVLDSSFSLSSYFLLFKLHSCIVVKKRKLLVHVPIIRFAIHNTMRLRCRGHSMTCGHVIHPPGLWFGAVLSIYAKRCFLQAHIIFPSPSVNNALFECVLPQILVIDGSWWFVGNISWITLYHADLPVPGTGVSCCSVGTSEILDSVLD